VFVAITRAVSAGITACELTHLQREPIDVERARAQHRAYEQALVDAGGTVERLDAADDLPDSVFVEDIAVVFDEIALITRPGAASRRRETAAIADALAAHRPVERIASPATVDGGDVLVIGRRVFVGLSSRTNGEAAAQMQRILRPHGYRVHATRVDGCLHLKSAVTALDEATVLVNPRWVDPAVFDAFERVEIDPAEPYAANALRVADRVIYPAAFPQTAERIAARGLRVEIVDASELAKAEGAVTCCSLIVKQR
jgi:dimethylargininase